ncbi:hypothetical protein [Bradyrhizobium sp. Leo170]|uniref:hypothetical protein n=1 Tax=Bradyrhizobium sp. Leo170 TaxID=1571199 RepID=UPI00102E8742|nr:hypothetical protein [Bradyrhizobium sp. Leo170]TAI61592.1 hypothetical protein CWO89_34380 [Bradyrhizobium sp. Leo170]
MSEPVPMRFIFVTMRETEQPVLNIQSVDMEELRRFTMSRDQLLLLNAQTADALLKGKTS